MASVALSAACSNDGPAESTLCPLIGCLSGARFRMPIDFSVAEALAATVKVCRNDECYAGTWTSTEPPASGSGSGFDLPDFGDHPERIDKSMSPHITVVLWQRASGVSLEVTWWPLSVTEPKDGDRYSVTMTTAEGRSLIDVARVADPYPDNSIGDGTCYQQCRYATFDVDPADECRVCGDGGS